MAKPVIAPLNRIEAIIELQNHWCRLAERASLIEPVDESLTGNSPEIDGIVGGYDNLLSTG